MRICAPARAPVPAALSPRADRQLASQQNPVTNRACRAAILPRPERRGLSRIPVRWHACAGPQPQRPRERKADLGRGLTLHPPLNLLAAPRRRPLRNGGELGKDGVVTLAPLSASCFASSASMPTLAPVMTTTLSIVVLFVMLILRTSSLFRP